MAIFVLKGDVKLQITNYAQIELIDLGCEYAIECHHP